MRVSVLETVFLKKTEREASAMSQLTSKYKKIVLWNSISGDAFGLTLTLTLTIEWSEGSFFKDLCQFREVSAV